jgi:hypothetical protein
MRYAKIGTAILLTTLVHGTAAGETLVREFRGSGDTTTVSFTVESPWLLDWRLDADYEQMVALDVSLIDVDSGRHVGRVLHTKRKGNGLKLFEEGGTYRLSISSTLARWRFRVLQITPEEAEDYTPKRQGQFDF